MGGAGEEKLNWLTILKTRVSSEQGRWTITSPLGRSWKTFQAHKAARTWHSAPFQPGTPAPILGHGWCLVLVSPSHSCCPRRWVWSPSPALRWWPAARHICSGAPGCSQCPECSREMEARSHSAAGGTVKTLPCWWRAGGRSQLWGMRQKSVIQ